MSEERRALVVKIGGEAFIKCLTEFGAGQTRDLLIYAASQGDWMATELLCLVPGTAALGAFLKRVPTFTVTEEEFEHWCKSCSFCWGEKPPATGHNPTTEEVKAALAKLTVVNGKIKLKKDLGGN